MKAMYLINCYQIMKIGHCAIENRPLFVKLGQHHQTMVVGPVASQGTIELIGTNGGGFYNANAAHPFQNPTPLTNIILII